MTDPALDDRRRRTRRLAVVAAILLLVTTSAVLLARLAGVGPGGAPAAGRIAITGTDGSLGVVDPAGGPVVPIRVPGVTFGAPAWSPDGTRIAAIGDGAEGSAIHVVPVPDGDGGAVPESTVVFADREHPPFYLYWSPDGARVAFLATEGTGISLRTAHADGRAPDDGQARDGILREGAPLYFSWEAADRMLVHVGAGPEAFAGAIDLSGVAAGPSLPGTGDFRSAASVAGGDRTAVVRGDAAAGEIVIETRDGSTAHTLPVFGPAAMAFDPAGGRLAAIAAVVPGASPLGVPMGPLRVVDTATGASRTLLDDPVVAFYWSPDGRTIAAIRLVPAGDSTTAALPRLALAGTGAERAAATPEPSLEVRVSFVDAATGAVRSDRAVRLGEGFVRTILPYFDQYALSHRVWAPGGDAIVLPLRDPDGRSVAMVLEADGTGDRVIADAIHAAWGP